LVAEQHKPPVWRPLYPFQSRWLRRHGLRYHYIDEGHGEPVVMVHGNPTWSFYYRSLIKALAPERRCIAPDHIGCGLSDKPAASRYDYRLLSRINDLEALLDDLEIKQGITLVVHDWGGMIGMGYAVRHPHRIARIVVTNTAAFLPPAGLGLPWQLWIIKHFRGLARLGVQGLNLFARGAVLMAAQQRLDPMARAGLLAPYDSPANRIATLKFVEDIPTDPKDPSYGVAKYVDARLHLLQNKPMLMCWGRHDFVFTMPYLSEWQRRFPRATVRVFDHAGHYLLEDAASDVIPAIESFLAEQ
jgi:haloalkane dehalogenase